MKLRFDRHFKMLRLCLWLIVYFSWFSCTTLRNDKPAPDFRFAELRIITNHYDRGWIAILSDEGLMPEILNSTLDEANSQAEIITVRIRLRNNSQLKIFQSGAASSGIVIADIKMD